MFVTLKRIYKEGEITSWTKRKSPASTSWPPRRKTPEGLTQEEREEQLRLRREYIDSVVGNLARELDNTYVVDEHGNKRKLRPKGEQ